LRTEGGSVKLRIYIRPKNMPRAVYWLSNISLSNISSSNISSSNIHVVHQCYQHGIVKMHCSPSVTSNDSKNRSSSRTSARLSWRDIEKKKTDLLISETIYSEPFSTCMFAL